MPKPEDYRIDAEMLEVQDMENALSYWPPQALLNVTVNGQQVRFKMNRYRQDPTIEIEL